MSANLRLMEHFWPFLTVAILKMLSAQEYSRTTSKKMLLAGPAGQRGGGFSSVWTTSFLSRVCLWFHHGRLLCLITAKCQRRAWMLRQYLWISISPVVVGHSIFGATNVATYII